MRQQPKHLVKIARRLRRKMTLPEVLLWNLLRPKVNTRCTIRRQVPVLNKYVLDFYCPQRKIAFEIDGYYIHEDQEEKDAERQQAIEELGVDLLELARQEY